MTVESVLSEFKTQIESNYDLEMFGSTEVTTSTPDGGSNTVTYYSGKEELVKVCEAIDKAKNSINTAFLYFFNDLEQPSGEHQNFLVINALSEVFRRSQSYSFETKEFTNKLWYAYTCGQLYASYSRGCTGEFLSTLYGSIPINISRLCTNYQELYDEFTPDTTAPDPEDPQSKPLPKTVQFWQQYGEEFQTEVEPYIDTFNTVVSDFGWLYNEITKYKDLGTTAAKLQAVGYVFTNTDERTQLVSSNMTDVFALCSGKFEIYDELVGNMYNLWNQSKQHVATEYPDLEEYNIASQELNVFTGVLLESINFYSDSETIYHEFLTFFSKYGIE